MKVIKLITKEYDKLQYKKGLIEYDINFMRQVNFKGELDQRIEEMEKELKVIEEKLSSFLSTNH